jgi:hypothetical protein
MVFFFDWAREGPGRPWGFQGSLDVPLCVFRVALKKSFFRVSQEAHGYFVTGSVLVRERFIGRPCWGKWGI